MFAFTIFKIATATVKLQVALATALIPDHELRTAVCAYPQSSVWPRLRTS